MGDLDGQADSRMLSDGTLRDFVAIGSRPLDLKPNPLPHPLSSPLLPAYLVILYVLTHNPTIRDCAQM